MQRHLLTLAQLTQDELLELLETSLEYKKLRARGLRRTGELNGKSVAMIFEKPSTRTRASFTVAVYEMGGLPVAYSREELQIGRGEPPRDTARVLSRYHDAIAARVFKHESLEELASFSSIPVINLLSDKDHPLQALADYMTILEKFGHISGIKISFIGDGRDNVLFSLAIAGLKLGAEVRVASPPQYFPDINELKRLAGEAYGSIKLYINPFEAVEGVDVIYTDVFVSMGQEHERDSRIKVFLPQYKVSRELIKAAGRPVLFMHCLPAHRGEEVDDEVLEGKESVVFEQAENRLHTAKAVLKFFVAER
ncbi:MAG: ornithine carbamoyltransferase [Thermofilaceae archaeon]|nr:ornithine carbamoyltransferase [Thermofilaceae archaeon]MCX8180214.1 ornithine carbamoyltransferase [Thermofilaceae archaeon]MDW8003604.1 ornithine carbamoyltransferase [Thermofilaceae archaeon]